MPDLQQRTLALRTAPRSHRSRLPAHVRRPYARSKDAAVTSTLGIEPASTQSPHAGRTTAAGRALAMTAQVRNLTIPREPLGPEARCARRPTRERRRRRSERPASTAAWVGTAVLKRSSRSGADGRDVRPRRAPEHRLSPERGSLAVRVPLPRRSAGCYLQIAITFERSRMPDTTCHMSISLDGFVAGPDQSREHPLGKRGREVHGWHLGDVRANEADATAAELVHAPARRLRHGPQHVRPDPRRVGRGLARLVGRRAAVPRTGVRAHPPRPRADRDGGRHDASTSSPTASTPPSHRRVRRPATAA